MKNKITRKHNRALAMPVVLGIILVAAVFGSVAIQNSTESARYARFQSQNELLLQQALSGSEFIQQELLGLVQGALLGDGQSGIDIQSLVDGTSLRWCGDDSSATTTTGGLDATSFHCIECVGEGNPLVAGQCTGGPELPKIFNIKYVTFGGDMQSSIVQTVTIDRADIRNFSLIIGNIPGNSLTFGARAFGADVAAIFQDGENSEIHFSNPSGSLFEIQGALLTNAANFTISDQTVGSEVQIRDGVFSNPVPATFTAVVDQYEQLLNSPDKAVLSPTSLPVVRTRVELGSTSSPCNARLVGVLTDRTEEVLWDGDLSGNSSPSLFVLPSGTVSVTSYGDVDDKATVCKAVSFVSQDELHFKTSVEKSTSGGLPKEQFAVAFWSRDTISIAANARNLSGEVLADRVTSITSTENPSFVIEASTLSMEGAVEIDLNLRDATSAGNAINQGRLDYWGVTAMAYPGASSALVGSSIDGFGEVNYFYEVPPQPAPGLTFGTSDLLEITVTHVQEGTSMRDEIIASLQRLVSDVDSGEYDGLDIDLTDESPDTPDKTSDSSKDIKLGSDGSSSVDVKGATSASSSSGDKSEDTKAVQKFVEESAK